MQTVIYYSAIYLIEALILWIYCSNMFYSRFSKQIECISIIGLYLLPFLCAFQNNLWLNTLIFPTANFIYIFFIYHSKIHSALFHAAITTIAMGLSELVASGIIANLPYNIYEETSNLQNLAIAATLSKVLYLLCLQTIIFLYKKLKEKNQNFNHGIGMLITIPIFTIAITLFLIIISVSTELPAMQDCMISISAILMLIINILILGIYTYNQEKSEEFTKLQLQLQKEYDSTEYYKLLNEQNESQNILIHDIKKHLNSIALLNEQGEHNKVASYIESIINSSNLKDSICTSDNTLLNSVLSRYMRKCQNKNILFRTDIRSGCADFLTEEDLTALFCNLLDNAFEAALNQENSFIEINMEKREHTVFSILTLTNSCNSDPFEAGTKKLVSKKKNASRHGFGLKSIHRIVKKYSGDIEMYYNANSSTFHTIIMLKNNS